MRARDAPKVGDGNLELLLDGPGRVGLARRRAALEDGELLLLGLDLEDEVAHALFEVLLRRLSRDELLARGRVVGRLRSRTRNNVSCLLGLHTGRWRRRERGTHKLVDALLERLALDLLAKGELAVAVRLLVELVLEVGAASVMTRSQ